MKSRIYLEKFFVFSKEAFKDVEIGCYNKAISSFWFSIEALMRSILIHDRKNPPERAGRLISVFVRLYSSGDFELLDALNRLYFMKREIDHREKLADKKYLEKGLKYFKEIIKKITNLKTVPNEIREEILSSNIFDYF